MPPLSLSLCSCNQQYVSATYISKLYYYLFIIFVLQQEELAELFSFVYILIGYGLLLNRKLEEESTRINEAEKTGIDVEEQKKQLEQQFADILPYLLSLDLPSPILTPHSRPLHESTSLNGISVQFSDSDKISRKGNLIVHADDCFDARHCFIGGEMQSV